jgi:hypothetical protein
LADVELRRILGAERFRSLADSAVNHVEERRNEYEAAARQAERRSIVNAADLLEEAELEDLGELLGGALEAVIVERGRAPISTRVRIVPRDAPSEVWLPTTQDSERGRVKTRQRRR